MCGLQCGMHTELVSFHVQAVHSKHCATMQCTMSPASLVRPSKDASPREARSSYST